MSQYVGDRHNHRAETHTQPAEDIEQTIIQEHNISINLYLKDLLTRERLYTVWKIVAPPCGK